jgi:hypothetical protein
VTDRARRPAWSRVNDILSAYGFGCRSAQVCSASDDELIVDSALPAPGRRMRLRYAGTCRSCDKPVAAGQWAVHHRDAKQVECLECAERVSTASTSAQPQLEQQQAGSGTAGASARREHQRRVAKREQRVRAAHPHIGGFLLAISDEPQSTRAWAVGAHGEELLAKRLDRLCDQGVLVLHDRRIPGTHANIDHIAVGPSGVFVIDAKRYKGRPHLQVQGGVLRPRTGTLMVGSRDCTKLIEGVSKQVELVRAALAVHVAFVTVPVRGMLCFVDADWPLVGGSFAVSNIDVLWPNKAADRIRAGETLSPETVGSIHAALAEAFLAA